MKTHVQNGTLCGYKDIVTWFGFMIHEASVTE